MAILHDSIKPKQSLGQNFLVDDNIARNIVRDLKLQRDDIVVEIGPGQGALTKHLAQQAKYLVAIEIDKRVASTLRKQFQADNIEIVIADFLKFSLTNLYKKFNRKLRLVGNIPYHLTSPILFKAFEEREAIEDLTIMIQKEVAKRITAHPNSKDYGILSVFSQYYGMPKSFFNVSSACFYPKPKVTSTVIHLQMNERLPYQINDEIFRTVVRTAFGKRRKTLRNSLSYLPYDEEIVGKILKIPDFPFDKRAEQLSIKQFAELTSEIELIL